MTLLNKLLVMQDGFYGGMLLVSILPCSLFLMLYSRIQGELFYRLGDPMPKLNGRCSWNPVYHIHPVGLVVFITTGLGWSAWMPSGKQPVNHPRSKRIVGFLLGWGTCLAISLLCFALAGSLIARAEQSTLQGYLSWVLMEVGVLGVGLGLFQWLPLPNFLGYYVLLECLPETLACRLERWTPQITLLYTFFLWTGFANSWIAHWMSWVIYPFCVVTGLPFEYVVYLL